MGQQGPDRACHLVGECYRDDVRRPTLGQAQRPIRRRFGVGEHRAGAVDQQGAQIAVPTLGDAEHAHPPAGADVPGHQSQPSGELPSGLERARIAHRGNRRGRAQHPDAWDRRDPPTGGIVLVPQREPPLHLADLFVEPDHARPLLAQGLHDHRRQSLRDPLQRRGDASYDAGPALRHDFAVFGQQPTQAVDLSGTELQPAAGACGAAPRSPVAPRS